MYTCNICDYSLNIGKITSSSSYTVVQMSDPSEFIKLTTTKKKNNINTNNSFELLFDINTLNSVMQKLNLTQDVSTIITEKFNNIKKNMRPNAFCLKCTNCNETFVLPPGILMTFKLKKTNNYNTIINIDDIISDYTLPRTRDFICSNKKCKADIHSKEAIIYRPNPAEYVTHYICVNCKTFI